MFAVAGGHKTVVVELVAGGANMNRKDYSGTKALGYTVTGCSIKAHSARKAPHTRSISNQAVPSILTGAPA